MVVSFKLQSLFCAALRCWPGERTGHLIPHLHTVNPGRFTAAIEQQQQPSCSGFSRLWRVRGSRATRERGVASAVNQFRA